MGSLLGYFQKPRVDSEGQLRQAQAAARSYTPEQEARARAAGFRSADEMVLFERQRQQRSGGTVSRPRKSGRMSMSDLMSWHPKETISRASEALRSATERR